jgi:hypothetical protein
MRYTGRVSNAFVQSMAHNFEQALRLMAAALTDCPDDLWQTDLWPDEAPPAPAPHGGLHGSAPRFLGYHALNTLDYDRAGEFEPWAPPRPFDDNTYGFPNRRFSKPELLGYVDWCRGRVRQTVEAPPRSWPLGQFQSRIDTTEFHGPALPRFRRRRLGTSCAHHGCSARRH